MKKIWEKIKNYGKTYKITNKQPKNELERKAVEGAHKALKDYGRVFERLAEYDKK